jgi:hypothetical protein
VGNSPGEGTYMTERLMSVQKHSSFNIRETLPAPNFLVADMFGTDVSCHKPGTNLISCSSLRLSPHPHSAMLLDTGTGVFGAL